MNDTTSRRGRPRPPSRTSDPAAGAADLAVPTAAVHPDGTIVAVNRAFAELFGTEPATLAGSSWLTLVHPDDRDAVAARLAGPADRGGQDRRPSRHRYLTGDGRVVWGMLIVAPATGPAAGRADHLVAHLVDVSADAAAEAALAAREAWFRHLVEHAIDPVVVVDPGGTIAYASPAAGRLLGVDADRLAGRDTFAFVHPDDRDRLRAAFAARSTRPGTRPPRPLRVAGGGGRWRVVDPTVTNLADHPVVGGIVVNLREVTGTVEAVAAVAPRPAVEPMLADVAGRLAVAGGDDDIAAAVAAVGAGLGADRVLLWRRGDGHDRRLVAQWAAPGLGPCADDLPAPPAGTPAVRDGIAGLGPCGDTLAAAGARTLLGAPVAAAGGPDGYLLAVGADRPWPAGAAAAVETVAATIAAAWARLSAQTRLRASEARFASLYANASDLIVVRDTGGTVTWVSDAVTRVLGWSAAEFVGQPAAAHVHPDDLDAFGRLHARVAAAPAGTALRHLARLRHRDGSWRWMQGTVTNLADDPAVGGIVANLRDVTDEHTLAAALGETERRFRSLVQHASDLTVVIAPDLTVSYVSPSVRRILGWDPDDLVGSPAGGLAGPADRDRFVGLLRDRLAGVAGEAPTLHRVRHADGTFRWLRAVSTDRRDDPAVGGLVVNAADVTDQVEATAALRRRLRFEQLVAGAAGRLLDADGFDDHVHAVLAELAGLAAADLAVLSQRTPAGTMRITHVWAAAGTPRPAAVDWDPAVLDRLAATPVGGAVAAADLAEVAGPAARLARRAGLAAAAAAPIRTGAGLAATLTLASRHARAWEDDVVDLLGQLAGLFALALSRRDALAAVAASEERHRALVEHASDIIALLDGHGRVLSVNPAAARALGAGTALRAGASVGEIAHPDDRERLAGELAGLAGRPGGIVRTSLRAAHCDGSWRCLEGIAQNRLADPAVAAIVVSLRDVTERVESEQAIRRLAGELEDRLAELSETRAELAAALGRQVEQREQERAGLARSLHDDAVQALAAAQLTLNSLGRTADPAERDAAVEEARAYLLSVIGATRGLLDGLRPPALADHGLAVAIAHAVDAFAAAAGVEARVDGQLRRRLPDAVETLVYRAVAEALDNAARHAAATRVEVRLADTDAAATIEIVDDGVGLDGADLGRAARGGRVGVLTMREALAGVGGSFSVADRPDRRGTLVRIVVPYPPAGRG